MTGLSNILSSIPILRNFASNPDSRDGSSTSRSADDIRRQAIQDTVDISPSASRSLEALDTNSELSQDEVRSLLTEARGVLESNDNHDLGLNPAFANQL